MLESDELLIIPVRYCSALNRSKTRCSRIINDGDYCSSHSKLYRFPRPSDCPICTECMKDELRPLDCGHWVHRSCMLQWKAKCPICMTQVKITREERKLLPPEPSDDNDLTDQAILNMIIQDINIEFEFQPNNTLGDITLYNLIEELVQTIAIFSPRLTTLFLSN